MIKGYAGRLLEVDLTRETWAFRPIDPDVAPSCTSAARGTRRACSTTRRAPASTPSARTTCSSSRQAAQRQRRAAGEPVLMQNLMCSVNSMVLCMFSTYGMVPRQIHALPPSGLLHRMASAVFENSGPLIRMVVRRRPKTGPVLWFEKWLTFITGRPFSLGHLQEIGARIFNLERMYNLREGLTGADDTLPPRLLAEPTFKHQSRGHPLEELLPRYYRLRGWDAGGVPTKETLDELRVQV